MEATSNWPHKHSIRECDSVESLLEEEILQTNINDLKTMAVIFLDPNTKLVYPLHWNYYQSIGVPN